MRVYSRAASTQANLYMHACTLLFTHNRRCVLWTYSKKHACIALMCLDARARMFITCVEQFRNLQHACFDYRNAHSACCRYATLVRQLPLKYLHLTPISTFEASVILDVSELNLCICNTSYTHALPRHTLMQGHILEIAAARRNIEAGTSEGDSYEREREGPRDRVRNQQGTFQVRRKDWGGAECNIMKHLSKHILKMVQMLLLGPIAQSQAMACWLQSHTTRPCCALRCFLDSIWVPHKPHTYTRSRCFI